MRKFLKSVSALALILAIAIATSCSNKGKDLTFIPKNAGIIFHVDGKSIAEKSGVEDITTTNLYKMMKENIGQGQEKAFADFEPILKNTAESGINTLGDMYFFTFKKEEVNYYAAHLNLTDKAKFETFIKKISATANETINLKELDGFTYYGDGEGSPVMMWNDKSLMLLADMTQANAIEKTAQTARSLFTAKKSESIVSTDDLDSFLKNKKDMNVWLNYEYFFESLAPMQKMLMQSNLAMDFKGVTVAAYLDFQDGQTVMEFETTMNDEMKKRMEENKIFKSEFDKDILKYFPAKTFLNISGAIDVLGYYNLVMKGLEEQQVSPKQMDESVQSSLGMTLKEALNEFSGELVFNLHGFTFVDKEVMDYEALIENGGEGDPSKYTKMVKSPMPLMSFGTVLNGDKLFSILMEKFGTMVVKNEGYYSVALGDYTLYFNMFEKSLVATNDLALITKIAKGDFSGSLEKGQVADNLDKFPFYAFIDLNFDNYPAEIKDWIAENTGENSKAVFGMLSIYDRLEFIPENYFKGKVILMMKDKKTNSLKSVISSIDQNIGNMQ